MLSDEALQVFLDYHRPLMYAWDLGKLFAAMFGSLLFWSVVYALCAEDTVDTQIQVFAYPLAGFLGLAVLLMAIEWMTQALSTSLVGLFLGDTVEWLAVNSVASFLTVVITKWAPSGSSDNAIVSSCLIMVVFVVTVAGFFVMRRARDRHATALHYDTIRWSKSREIPSEKEVHQMLHDAENKYYAQNDMVGVWGMPLISKSNLLYRPISGDSTYHPVPS